MAYLLQQCANAVPLAALYAGLAFGYAIAFAVIRRADIVYGAIFALSGQLYLLAVHIGWDRLVLVMPAALALGAVTAVAGSLLVSGVMARFVIRPLAEAAPNALIVAALGSVLVLTEGARLVSGGRQLWLSPFLDTAVPLVRSGGWTVSLTVMQIVNAATIAGLVAIGALVLARHRWGRFWRAVADDPAAARLCGVDAGCVLVLSYLAATAYAAICGVLATSYYGTMEFGAGLLFGLKVVLIAAAGGHMHPLRAAAGAGAMALAETLWSGYGPILWRDFVVMAGLVAWLVITRRERVTP